MSRPLAWSSFFALITGGMKAPSDGGLKITMETFSSACARRSLAPSIANAMPSQMLARQYRNNCIVTLPETLARLPLCRAPDGSASGEAEQFGRQAPVDPSRLIGREPGLRHDAHGL